VLFRIESWKTPSRYIILTTALEQGPIASALSDERVEIEEAVCRFGFSQISRTRTETASRIRQRETGTRRVNISPGLKFLN
jgi:hypothetical protein